ncbi:MAG: hypothetical protein KDA58_08140 [Planctomycetaceae bacterium]|nr:hypothetical protein [Planctomycetaceae bacterium]
MAKTSTVIIDLGTRDELIQLYSWPNQPGSKESLPKTILHWFEKTLRNDGFTGAKAATAEVLTKGKTYQLQLTGPKGIEGYAVRLPIFLDHGRAALKRIEEIKEEDKQRAAAAQAAGKKQPKNHWDPRGLGNWRFFMPHGLAMLNQRSIQFFHYPPIRLLETDRDYLQDPVPKRWEELLVANGVPQKDVELYECVMDAVPVGALDDEGSAKDGGMPIDDFAVYQTTQVDLLLGEPNKAGYTMPIVVYGSSPRKRFFKSYKQGFPAAVVKAKAWNTEDPQRIVIKPGSKTPVLAMNHPYSFFMDIQDKKGAHGEEFIPGVVMNWRGGIRRMLESLIAARWQRAMAADPSQDPKAVYKDCQTFWGYWPTKKVTVKGRKQYVNRDQDFQPAADKKQRDAAAAMILHQASLEAGLTGEWSFVRSLADSKKIVSEFNRKGAVSQSSLLPAEKAETVNAMLAMLCPR